LIKKKKKMKMNMRSSVMLLALSLGAVASFGQCKLTWPEDPEVRAKAEEKVALYDDAKTQKNYRAAVAPLQWMLNTATKWST